MRLKLAISKNMMLNKRKPSKAESLKKTGKALHEEALRFKEDSIIDSATSIKQINKLKKVLFCFDMLYGK